MNPYDILRDSAATACEACGVVSILAAEEGPSF